MMRHPLITKEDFVKYINHLKDMDHKEDVLANAFESIDADTDLVYLSLYSQERRDVIDLLNMIVGASIDEDYGSMIEYFIYDLNYGADYYPGCITEVDGAEIDLSSAEALYDYYFPTQGERP